jgi:hypothetical protein
MTRRPRSDRSARLSRYVFVLFDLFVLFVLFVFPATAQTRAPRVNPRLEVSIGTGLLSGSDLGDGAAELRARDGGSLTLFTTGSTFAFSVPLEVRLGFLLSRRWTFEAGAAFSRPELRTSVGEDFEGAPPLRVSERIDRYVVDGALVYGFGGRQSRGAVPFVAAGMGWVRQVHQGLTLTEDGVSIRGGGGIKYPLVVHDRGALRRLGLRAEGSLVVLSNGVTVGAGAVPHLAASGFVYVAF